MAKKKSSDSNDGTNSHDGQESNGKRQQLSQADMPSYSIDEALRIPRAIGDNYAFDPTRPLDVAAALRIQPTSSGFRMLTSAAIAYGLTDGGSNATTIAVTQLARRILEPQSQDDELQARRQAFLRPRVPKEFLTKYDSHKLPSDVIAKNVLTTMGVPEGALDRTLKLIVDGAKQAGFLVDIRGVSHVNLQGTTRNNHITEADVASPDSDIYEPLLGDSDSSLESYLANKMMPKQVDNRQVFITHGKDKSFIEPLKEVLKIYDLEPVVSIERESVSQSIPDKVMNDMRSCWTAVIHIGDEQKLRDSDGNEQIVLNSNVLIEIGAAMAFYEKKFILLVQEGITLPSNLHGLFEIRYKGETLSWEIAVRLIKAVKDMKNSSLSVVSA